MYSSVQLSILPHNCTICSFHSSLFVNSMHTVVFKHEYMVGWLVSCICAVSVSYFPPIYVSLPRRRSPSVFGDGCGDRCREDGRREVVGVGVSRCGGVALVLLAEAHLALAAALRHAHVVHHEHVNVYVVGAAATDLHVGYKREEGSNRAWIEPGARRTCWISVFSIPCIAFQQPVTPRVYYIDKSHN